jgi:peroxiredoxin
MRKLSLLGIVVGLLATTALAAAARSRGDDSTFRNPIGDTLPSLILRLPNGQSQSLRERLGHKPALLYIFNKAECLGCSDLALEFRVIRREAPGVEPLLIGSGSSPADFARALSDIHLEGSALIDEHRSLLAALRVKAEPLVLLVNANGRILVVDNRNTSRAALHPMGEILHELKASLSATTTGATR